VKIKDISAKVNDNILTIWSKTPLRILSSAVLNGGLQEANGIINVQVPEGCGCDKNDVHWRAEEFLNKEAQRLQLPKEKVVGLMTAAKMQNIAVYSERCNKTALTVFVTAGSTVAVTAGEPAASKNGAQKETIGTINIILLVDGNLTESCMVDAVKTITEAKTVALRELDIRSRFSGDIASGTLTDSVVVGCTKNGGSIQYAGTFTMFGELIGKCVRKAVKTAIYKQEKLVPSRTLMERLAERGISHELIMSLIFEQKIIEKSSYRQQFQRQVDLILSDRKVVPLIMASLRLDDDLRKGLIPANAADNIDNVSFEDIVQKALRCSLSDEDLFLFDNSKKKCADVTFLGPFTKCLLKAILKKAYSNIS
jgi:adenosylcobinamide hydrolase